MKQKQPLGMYLLASTEVFERLSYYTLSYILVLYLSDKTPHHGGLGWSNADALALMGLFSFASYTLPIFGSYIADNFLGSYRSAILGGFTIILGHFFMLFSVNILFLYLGLACVAFGTCFFKPCMPSLLGGLYGKSDSRRESGFSWYYVGINVGAMVAGITSGSLARLYGYHVALASAGLGMIVGMCVFYFGRHHIVIHKEQQIPNRKRKPVAVNPNPVPENNDRKKKALFALFAAFAFFLAWATVFNIAMYGTLTLYLENFTNKIIFGYDVPTTYFLSLESVVILVATPVFTYGLYMLSQRKKYPHSFTQMNVAIWISTLAIGYLTYLSYIGQHVQPGEKPFQWYDISIFIAMIAVSEIMISPVMMSAISEFAPEKNKSLFQSFYLALFGVSSLAASKIGSLSLAAPFKTFLILTIVLCVLSALYSIFRKKMVLTAKGAAVPLPVPDLHH